MCASYAIDIFSMPGATTATLAGSQVHAPQLRYDVFHFERLTVAPSNSSEKSSTRRHFPSGRAVGGARRRRATTGARAASHAAAIFSKPVALKWMPQIQRSSGTHLAAALTSCSDMSKPRDEYSATMAGSIALKASIIAGIAAGHGGGCHGAFG